MASTITHKRSAIAGKVPTVAQLALGEIAINTRDGKIYIKRDNGTAQVLEIGATGPQGPEGPTGAAGPQGPQGPQGPAGSAADVASATAALPAGAVGSYGFFLNTNYPYLKNTPTYKYPGHLDAGSYLKWSGVDYFTSGNLPSYGSAAGTWRLMGYFYIRFNSEWSITGTPRIGLYLRIA